MKLTPLEQYLRGRRQQWDTLVVGHIMAGYPSFDENITMASLMAEGGVDLVELQMPFTEPIADGPTFALASQTVAAEGIRVSDYFALMQRILVQSAVPVVAMGYYNWPYSMGLQHFAQTLHESGAMGWIIPDLPIEEATPLRSASQALGLASVFMMTPTDSAERLSEIGSMAEGFSYCALRRGVTGQKTVIDESTARFLGRCRQASSLPLAAAFGVESGSDVDLLKEHTDMVIVGSALLRVWQSQGSKGFSRLVHEIRAAAM